MGQADETANNDTRKEATMFVLVASLEAAPPLGREGLGQLKVTPAAFSAASYRAR